MKKTLTILAAVALLGGCCSDNQKLPTRVACIGDSITEGFGIAWQSDNSYPALLDSILGDDYAVMNFGRSSTTTLRDGDFPYWSAKEFRNALNYRPEIVIIKLGTNDCKAYQWNAEKFEKSYQSLVDTLRSAGNPVIKVCLPIPVTQLIWEMNDSVITNGVIPVIRTIAERNSLEIIDLYSVFENHQEWYLNDGVHPNRDGAKIIAERVAQAVKK